MKITFQKKQTGFFVVKIISYFLITLSLYLLILSDKFLGMSLAILFILFGVFITIFLFSIAHDASHNAISNKQWVNRLFAYIWNAVGISSYFWALKHNLAHHSFTNIPGKDDDIDQSKLVRLNPNSTRRWFHRFQHLYAPFLYSLLSLNIIYFKDFALLFQHNFGNKTISKHPVKEIWILIATKIFFVSYMIIIPKFILDISWTEIIGYHILMHLVIGLFIGFILVPVHVTGESEYRLPDAAGKIHCDWGSHQSEATVDFAANNYFINWVSGGLNTHVVHHLFPSINHIHYYSLTKIIKYTALEYNFTYRNYSLVGVFKDHLRFLKKLGRMDNPSHNACFD
ncbi:MAG: acyl-CoA desaturase [Saprospiraceae bacterium]|nr:acyl-CoA desaturase [Saprospiraceae bacterium]